MEGAPDELARRIEALGADRISGASELLAEALAILFAARSRRADMWSVAQMICRAQPTMAPMWNAVAAALSEDPDRLSHFAERVRRAPAALARYARGLFSEDVGTLPTDGPPEGAPAERALHLVTLSFSASVVTAILAIRERRPVRISCGESRPALEGRRLATALAGAGIPVTCYADAAVAAALEDADAVLMGADAVAPGWFLNKIGSLMLAAAAHQRGVPVYVGATVDKFVAPTVAERLVVRRGSPDEVWKSAPAGVIVQNPYFESTPLDTVTGVISDRGVLGIGMISDVCAVAPVLPDRF